MNEPAISLDAAGSPGAVLSAVTSADGAHEKKLLELDGLALVGANPRGPGAHVWITNLSSSEMELTGSPGGERRRARPGERLALPLPVPTGSAPTPPPAICARLVVADAVAITLIVTVDDALPGPRILTQALVSR